MEKVVKVRASHKRMGSRQMHYAAAITEIGITKFEKWMSSQNMTVPIKRRRIVTTQSGIGGKLPNLINGLELNNINQAIAGDITYYQVKEKLYYIFTLKDMYSKRIVGLYGNINMNAETALKALNQVLKLRAIENVESMIHHTDGGTQYKALIYRARLKGAKIRISMAGNCLENGLSEQLNGVLKNDYLESENITSVKALNTELNKIKRLINNEKPVKELGYKTPVEFENSLKTILLKDRKIIKLHDFRV